MTEEKRLFSTAEAAEFLGIAEATLRYHLYTAKNIEATKIGHSLVFTREQLEHFKETRRKPGRPTEDNKKN